MSEDEAVSLAQRGDESAFSFLYAVHHPRIFAYCRRQLKSKEDAEDVTQDIFLLVHRNIKTYQGNSSFSTWLHRITNNAVVSHVRKQKLDFDTVDITESSQPATQQFVVEIKEALHGMTDLQRLCSEANAMGYSMKDLGGAHYLHSARRKLKR